MRIFIASINNIDENRINELDLNLQQKVSRLKMADDKKRCIAGGLFMNRFLDGAKITENEYGKPLADNGKCFNISHSGEYVLFVLSDVEIGCDIEKIREVNPEKMGKFVFSEDEMCEIGTASDKTDKFFEFWTKKESLLKCIGEGFHRSAKSVNVTDDFYADDKVYYFKMWRLSDYMISVCSIKNEFSDSIEFIEL